MEKKSIGSFLAALRKANGLTQEEVAQRLFVSNKTVSKWERDESSPDLAFIPVLAEIYGVTCDEILRGERGEKAQGSEDRAHIKAEKQAQHIVSRTVNQFRSISIIAAALTILGLMLHFVVAYTYFKPLVAFGLGLAFLIGSAVLEMIQLIKTNAALQDGGMLGESAISSSVTLPLLHRIAFTVFTLNIWAVILIWPMVSAQGLDYANSVVSFHEYLSQLPMLAVICLCASSLALYFARHWLGIRIDEKSGIASVCYTTSMIRRIALLQGAFLLGLAAMFFVPSLVFVLIGGYETIGGILFLALMITIFVVMTVNIVRMIRGSKNWLERLLVILLSIRNVLFGIKIISVFSRISVYVDTTNDRPLLSWDVDDIPSAFYQMLLITLVYFIIKFFLVRKHKNNEKAQAVS